MNRAKTGDWGEQDREAVTAAPVTGANPHSGADSHCGYDFCIPKANPKVVGTILQQKGASLVLKAALLVRVEGTASCLPPEQGAQGNSFPSVGSEDGKLISNPAPQDSQNILLKQGTWNFFSSHPLLDRHSEITNIADF